MAARWLRRVLEAANSLEDMPERCERAEEDAYLPYDVRARRIGEYVLLYTIVEETRTVWIVNARHGRQLPQPGSLPEAVEDFGAEA